MFLLGDWFGLMTVSGLVLGTFGLGEWLRHRSRWASERTRKVIHIGCGVIIFFFPYLFKSVHTIGVLAAVFLALLLSTKLWGFMESIHAVRRNTAGVFYYPVSIYLTALLTWEHPALFQICILCLAFADGLAALVGKTYGRHRYHLGAHVRTLEGSLTVLGVSWISTFALLTLSGLATPQAAAIIGVLLAGIVCAVEALSLWGVDNLLIPLVSAAYLNAAIHWTPGLLYWHLGACLIAFGIATACQLKGYLMLNGAVAAWMVGYATLGFGGVAWFFPLLVFFMAINWVGKLAEKLAAHRLPPGFERIEEKGSRRDFVQVFANTGVAMALVMGYAMTRVSHPALAEGFFWAYIGSLCAAGADTFASEVGILSKSRPVLLWTFQPVPPGLSGGVTWFGYAAAAVGAVVPIGALFAIGSPYPFSYGAVVGAIACGWIGSTVDSLVGATLQSKRQCASCGRILEKAEHCGEATRHYRGHPRINNDLVNAIGALAGALCGAVFLNGWL
jgi:uncharacterized protein (TIGR00297 family)